MLPITTMVLMKIIMPQTSDGFTIPITHQAIMTPSFTGLACRSVCHSAILTTRLVSATDGRAITHPGTHLIMGMGATMIIIPIMEGITHTTVTILIGMVTIMAITMVIMEMVGAIPVIVRFTTVRAAQLQEIT